MQANGWADISYHFLIGGDNQIYEGRGWGRRGENVGLFSNQAINIGYIGNYRQAPPAGVEADLLDSLIQCGINLRALHPEVRTIAQCQVSTIVACEASTIFDWISEHPRFEANPRPV